MTKIFCLPLLQLVSPLRSFQGDICQGLKVTLNHVTVADLSIPYTLLTPVSKGSREEEFYPRNACPSATLQRLLFVFFTLPNTASLEYSSSWGGAPPKKKTLFCCYFLSVVLLLLQLYCKYLIFNIWDGTPEGLRHTHRLVTTVLAESKPPILPNHTAINLAEELWGWKYIISLFP